MNTMPYAPDDLLEVVRLIYAGTTDQGPQSEALRLLNKLLGAASTMATTREIATGQVLYSMFSDAKSAEAQSSHWSPMDPRAQWLASQPPGQPLRCDRHLDGRFLQSEFYRQMLLPNNLRWTLGVMCENQPGVVTFIGAMRAASSPPFEDWTEACLRQLVPHFQMASALRAKLDRQTVAFRSAKELVRLLPVPCLFTDQVGRCMEGNENFSHSLDALSLRLVTGRVRFSKPDLQRTWETALLETHATACPQTIEFDVSWGKPWEVHLLPWQHLMPHAEEVDKRLILALFKERLARATPQPGSMASAARLTRAEAEVLAGLLKGLPAKAIASRRSASVNTVRAQIVAILEKTGYNSQKELMASFSNSTLPDSVFSDSAAAHPATRYFAGDRR